MAKLKTSFSGPQPTFWYRFTQKSDYFGGYRYDGERGLSAVVFVEATSFGQALKRLTAAGGYCPTNYFDLEDEGEYTTSSRRNGGEPFDGTIPQAGEVLVTDTAVHGRSPRKLLPEGQADGFLHPLSGPVEGYHFHEELVYPKPGGFGLTWHERSFCSEVLPVREDGWDEEGNFRAPAPGYRESPWEENCLLREEEGFRLQEVAPSTEGRPGERIFCAWASTAEPLEELRRRVLAFQANLPVMDVEELTTALS